MRPFAGSEGSGMCFEGLWLRIWDVFVVQRLGFRICHGMFFVEAVRFRIWDVVLKV